MGSNCCKGDAARPVRSSSIYSRYIYLGILLAQEAASVPWVLRLPAPAPAPLPSRAGAVLDDRFTTSEEAGGVRLTVSTATTGDSGVYTLQASNAAGSDTGRIRLEVSAEETPTGEDPPTFLRRLQDLTVKVGTRTRFLVEIISSTECKVTWYRNERRLLEAERVSLARDGNLWCADVGAVSVDDAGRWTCTAENEGGRASCSAHLNVLVPKAYKRPEFVEELRALLTEQGTVSLECKVVGVPTPVLRWFKDSREIKAGDVFALTANAEDPTSLGTYTCEAVNCMGRAYSSSKVHVVGRTSRETSLRPSSSDVIPEPPPIFTKELEDHSVKVCDPLTLSCHVVVPPWPRSVVWYNKEGKVEPGERYHVLEDGVGGYLLEVPSAEWADEGEWKCVATSAGGRVGISTCFVAMEVPKNYRKPRFMENLQAVLTEEGLVSFECKVVGFPTPVLSWFKDGQELKPGDVYQLTGTNSLGSYCCIARNCMGQASSSAELTVEDIQNQLNEEEKLQLFSKNQAPNFIQGLKSVEAKIDEPFRFTVKVAIPPEPSVLWYRDEQPVDESNRCHLSKEERGSFYLDIQTLEFLDQAEWKCVAVNDFGHSVTSCFLKLIIPRHYKKPRFLENLQAILSEEGAVNLECKVIGVPQPVLKWYKDGEELKPGDIHRIISGQDGTCCLGTYTCEAQNCMGIAASSASLLGFDDSMKAKAKKAEEQALQRNLSLSTIHEERTSQMYDTPVGDITLDDKGEISFSFDGKEVSVSLYETPDLTEEEALQIVEMYADQLSENVTEHNVVELPPLRFVKETSTSGNLLMEAIIIDVSPDFFASPDEDLRTEADVEDISIADENGPPQLSLDQDAEIGGEDYLEKTMALLSDEKSDIPAKISRKKSDSQKSVDDFYSLSRDQSLSEEKRDDDTHISESELISYESARSSAKVKSKSSKPSAIDGQESSEPTKTMLFKEEPINIQAETLEQPEIAKQTEKILTIYESKTNKKRRSSRGSRRSSSESEKSINKSKEELLHLKSDIEQLQKTRAMTDDEFKTKISYVSDALTKVINDVQLIEQDIILKSELMSSAATASRSLEIISSIISPLSEIHSIVDAAKESLSESKEVTSSIFNSLPQSLRTLHQSLTIIEKCIDMETDTKTLVKKTCVAFIESCGAEMQRMISEITSITAGDYLQTESRVISEIDSLANEMISVVKFSADTIQARNLLIEASEIKHEEPSLEEKHLKDTQKAVFEFKSPVCSLLSIVENAESGNMIELSKIKNSNVLLNNMSASIQDLQMSLEQIESLSISETTSGLHKYNTEIIEAVVGPILKLRGAFEQLSSENKTEEDKAALKEVLSSIKQNLYEVSAQINSIEEKVGKFDVLQSDNKLKVLQKMAQSLISLENNLSRLEIMPEVQTHMNAFHKNLTKILEIVIESNDSEKYFNMMEICDAVNRINSSIEVLDLENAMPLASFSNILKIIQDCLMKNIFESELNCSIVSSITDILIGIQESINKAEEINLQIDSEQIQDLTTYQPSRAKVVVIMEHIDQTIAAINIVKINETTQELKSSLSPTLERICPILEELKKSVAAIELKEMEQDESISALSVLSMAQTLATPLCELNQNIIVLNQLLIENIESLKLNNDIIFGVAQPLHELHTTLEILQQDVISQCNENMTPYEVSVNMANAIQNLHSCIVMIQEQTGVEVVDDISTLEDISNIKTSADTLPSDRLVLPVAKETGIEQSLSPLIIDLPVSATAEVLQSLNEYLTVLQTPEVVDTLDTLSEVSDLSSLKSVVLGIEDLHNAIESVLHPVPMEATNNLSRLPNLPNLAVIAQPLREFQQYLSVLDTTNIPVYEDILDLPSEKVHSIIQKVSEFKDQLNKCNQAVLPAVDVLNNTFEISTKVNTLRNVCLNLKDVIENAKLATCDIVPPEIKELEEVVKNLLEVTDVSRDSIRIDEIKFVTEELYKKVVTFQEKIVRFTPQTSINLAQEAELIEIVGEVENNIAFLQQYNFVDLSRASDISSCTSPQLSLEIESESLVLMADILENAINVVQDYKQQTPVADLMIIEDFFKSCKNEFAIIRCLITKASSHKKIIRLLEEFKSLQSVVNDFKKKHLVLNLSDDVNDCLTTFLLHADICFENVENTLEKIIKSQSEMLITQPIAKLQAIEYLKEKSDCNEDFVTATVIKKLSYIIELSKPLTLNIQNNIIHELKQPSKSIIWHEESMLLVGIEDFSDFIETQSKLATTDITTSSLLKKLSSCIYKYQEFKDASNIGKTLMLLKCLSECTDIITETISKQTQAVENAAIKESALKDVLTEILHPLKTLQNQLVSIREQVISGVEEDTISIDITSTESLVQTMTELHKDIVKKIESEKSAVDDENIYLIMEVDQEIHTIQDSIQSMDNVEAVQVVKQITKPMEELEKSLHNVLSSNRVQNKQKITKDINSNIASLEKALERFINTEIDLLGASEILNIDMNECVQLAVDLKSFLYLSDEELNNPKATEIQNAKISLLKEILSKFDWFNTESYLEGKTPIEVNKLRHVFLTAYQLFAELDRTKLIDYEKIYTSQNEEKSADMLQHIDQYIELIEIVEEISAIIKIKDVKESFELARDLKESIATFESAFKSETNEVMMKEARIEQTILAERLQKALSALQVQVLDSAQELAPTLSADVLQRIARVTGQLQADLVAVTGIQIAVEASLPVLETISPGKTVMNTSTIDIVTSRIDTAEKSESTAMEQVGIISDIVKKSEQAESTTEIFRKLAAETNQISSSEDVVPFKNKYVTEETLIPQESTERLSEPVVVETLDIIENAVSIFETTNLAEHGEMIESHTKVDDGLTNQAVQIVETEKEIEQSSMADIGDFFSVKQETESNFEAMKGKILEEIEEFVSSETLNELSTKANFVKLKDAFIIAQELRETIAAVEPASDSDFVNEQNKEVLTNQLKLAEDLQNAVSVLQEEGVETLQMLAPYIKTEALQKVTDIVNNLRSSLIVVINNKPEVIEILEPLVLDKQEYKNTEEYNQSKEDPFNEYNLPKNVQDSSNQSIIKKVDEDIDLLPPELTEQITPINEFSIPTYREDIMTEEGKSDTTRKFEMLCPKEVVNFSEETKKKIEGESTSDPQFTDQPGTKAIPPDSNENTAFEITQSLDNFDKNHLPVELIQDAAITQTAVKITEPAILESTGNIEEKTYEASNVLSTSDQLMTSETIISTPETVESQAQQEQFVFKEMAAFSKESDLCLEKQSDANVVTTLGADSVENKSQTMAKLSPEQQLLQHIDEFIDDDVSEIIGEISNITHIDALKDSVSIAKELREYILSIDNRAVAEETSSYTQSNLAEEVRLTRKLQNALSILHTQTLDSAENITPLIKPELLQKVSEAITQLQKDLVIAVESNICEIIQSVEIPNVIKDQNAMNQLVALLQDINDTINVSSPDKNIEDTDTLKDTLDEVQTVIIKLKRDYDCAVNDTLNETLDDLECCVRSVQLQINEDSPPELLKEACETLLLLANNMNTTQKLNNSENASNITSNRTVLEKCANDTDETLKLLETASNIEPKNNNNLCNIILNLNSLTDCLKSLKHSFLSDADTLIENGVEVIQCLDKLEDQVFSLEKDVDSEHTLSANTRDNIITAAHAVYGSISNMRSTISSIQKRKLFENYAQPSELLLGSIKNVTTILVQNENLNKSDWKKFSKSIRKVLNHFEDIKFYINFDKTARVPSDSIFTKIILEDLKTNTSNVLMPIGMHLGTNIQENVHSAVTCIKQYLGKIDEQTSLEVKSKIPMFKSIAKEMFNVTNIMKVTLQEINQIVEESLPKALESSEIQVAEISLAELGVVNDLSYNIANKENLDELPRLLEANETIEFTQVHSEIDNSTSDTKINAINILNEQYLSEDLLPKAVTNYVIDEIKSSDLITENTSFAIQTVSEILIPETTMVEGCTAENFEKSEAVTESFVAQNSDAKFQYNHPDQIQSDITKNIISEDDQITDQESKLKVKRADETAKKHITELAKKEDDLKQEVEDKNKEDLVVQTADQEKLKDSQLNKDESKHKKDAKKAKSDSENEKQQLEKPKTETGLKQEDDTSRSAADIEKQDVEEKAKKETERQKIVIEVEERKVEVSLKSEAMQEEVELTQKDDDGRARTPSEEERQMSEIAIEGVKEKQKEYGIVRKLTEEEVTMIGPELKETDKNEIAKITVDERNVEAEISKKEAVLNKQEEEEKKSTDKNKLKVEKAVTETGPNQKEEEKSIKFDDDKEAKKMTKLKEKLEDKVARKVAEEDIQEMELQAKKEDELRHKEENYEVRIFTEGEEQADKKANTEVKSNQKEIENLISIQEEAINTLELKQDGDHIKSEEAQKDDITKIESEEKQQEADENVRKSAKENQLKKTVELKQKHDDDMERSDAEEEKKEAKIAQEKSSTFAYEEKQMEEIVKKEVEFLQNEEEKWEKNSEEEEQKALQAKINVELKQKTKKVIQSFEEENQAKELKNETEVNKKDEHLRKSAEKNEAEKTELKQKEENEKTKTSAQTNMEDVNVPDNIKEIKERGTENLKEDPELRQKEEGEKARRSVEEDKHEEKQTMKNTEFKQTEEKKKARNNTEKEKQMARQASKEADLTHEEEEEELVEEKKQIAKQPKKDVKFKEKEEEEKQQAEQANKDVGFKEKKEEENEVVKEMRVREQLENDAELKQKIEENKGRNIAEEEKQKIEEGKARNLTDEVKLRAEQSKTETEQTEKNAGPKEKMNKEKVSEFDEEKTKKAEQSKEEVEYRHNEEIGKRCTEEEKQRAELATKEQKKKEEEEKAQKFTEKEKQKVERAEKESDFRQKEEEEKARQCVEEEMRKVKQSKQESELQQKEEGEKARKFAEEEKQNEELLTNEAEIKQTETEENARKCAEDEKQKVEQTKQETELRQKEEELIARKCVEEAKQKAEQSKQETELKQKEEVEKARKFAGEEKKKAEQAMDEAKIKQKEEEKKANFAEEEMQRVEQAEKETELKQKDEEKARKCSEEEKQKVEQSRQESELKQKEEEEKARTFAEEEKQKVEPAMKATEVKQTEAEEKASKFAEDEKQKVEQTKQEAEFRQKEEELKASKSVEEEKQKAEESKQEMEHKQKEVERARKIAANEEKQKVELATDEAEIKQKEEEQKANFAEEETQKTEKAAKDANLKQKDEEEKARKCAEEEKQNAEQSRQELELIQKEEEEETRTFSEGEKQKVEPAMKATEVKQTEAKEKSSKFVEDEKQKVEQIKQETELRQKEEELKASKCVEEEKQNAEQSKQETEIKQKKEVEKARKIAADEEKQKAALAMDEAEIKQKEEEKKANFAEEEMQRMEQAEKDANVKQEDEKEKARKCAEEEKQKADQLRQESELKLQEEEKKARKFAEEEKQKVELTMNEAEAEQKETEEKARKFAEEEKQKIEQTETEAELSQKEKEKAGKCAVEENQKAEQLKKELELKQKEEEKKARKVPVEEQLKVELEVKKAEVKQKETEEEARKFAEEEKQKIEQTEVKAELRQKEEEKSRTCAEEENRKTEQSKKESDLKQKEEKEKARKFSEEEKQNIELAIKQAEVKQKEEVTRKFAEEEEQEAKQSEKKAELRQKEEEKASKYTEEKQKVEQSKQEMELKQKEEEEKAKTFAEEEKQKVKLAIREAEVKQREEEARKFAEEEEQKAKQAEKKPEPRQKEEKGKVRNYAEEEKQKMEQSKQESELKQKQEDERIIAEEERLKAEQSQKESELKQKEAEEKEKITAEEERQKIEQSQKKSEQKEVDKARKLTEKKKQKVKEIKKKETEPKQKDEQEKTRKSAQDEKQKKEPKLKQKEQETKARKFVEEERQKEKEEQEKARKFAEKEKQKVEQSKKKDAELKQKEENEKARKFDEEEKQTEDQSRKEVERKQIEAVDKVRISEQAQKETELKKEAEEQTNIFAEKEKHKLEQLENEVKLKQKVEEEKAGIFAENERQNMEQTKKEAKQKEEEEKARHFSEKEKQKAEQTEKETKLRQKEEEKAKKSAEEQKQLEDAKKEAELKKKHEEEKAIKFVEDERQKMEQSKKETERKQKEEEEKARKSAEEEKQKTEQLKKEVKLKQKEEEEKERKLAEEKRQYIEQSKKEAEQKEEEEKARESAETLKQETEQAMKEAELRQKEEEKVKKSSEEQKQKVEQAKKEAELKRKKEEDKARKLSEKGKQKAEQVKKEANLKQKEEEDKTRKLAEEENQTVEQAKKEAELKEKEGEEKARKFSKEEQMTEHAKKRTELTQKVEDENVKNIENQSELNQKQSGEAEDNVTSEIQIKTTILEQNEVRQTTGNLKFDKAKKKAKPKKENEGDEKITLATEKKQKTEKTICDDSKNQEVDESKSKQDKHENVQKYIDGNVKGTLLNQIKITAYESEATTMIGKDDSSKSKHHAIEFDVNNKKENGDINYQLHHKSITTTKSSQRISDDTDQHYIKEYQYEPSPTRTSHDLKEKPRFVNHNHRDYTMDFARPTSYRERSFDIDKPIEDQTIHDLGKNATIYKAQTIVLDAQLRSSASPYLDTSTSSEPNYRKPEIRQKLKALSEGRSLVSDKKSGISRDSKRKPVFSTYLTDRTAVEGSRVKLTCSVLSSTDLTISWYKNGVLLDNKLKYRIKYVDGLITLEVLNAVPSDSAEYSCSVKNENGSVSSSANLKVYPSFEASPIPPTFTRSIRDTYHLAENELVLECRIRGQPLPTITWWKDDQPILSKERFQAYYLADGVCRLAIESPTPEDSGKYTCKAENSVWSDQITHVVTFTGKESCLSPNIVTIEKSRFNRQAIESRRPHFTNVLTDYKVAKGGTIGLQVEIRGAPTSVEWLREGRSVTDVYRNAKIFVEQGLYTLALTDVTEKETGMYTCRAWSAHGNVDMNAAITVVQPNELEGKPAIIVGRPEKNILISVGEDVNISFRVQGDPKPKVLFMKGIRDITTSQRVCKMTSDDYVKFTLKRSVITDAGTYCILARNAYGCDRAFVTVVVRQRASSDHLISDWTYPADDTSMSVVERNYKSVPKRIPGEPTVVDGGGNWVSLSWPKPEPSVSAPVLAFRVESWRLGTEGGARWVELGITPLNSFDVFNLKQGEEYHFRITPRNRYGWGESVQTLKPIAIGLAGDRPEFVDILPGQLKVLAGETANLKCSVKGKPMPEVVWMKNGHEIEEENGRVCIAYNGVECGLTIKEIGIEDEARYSCEATNVHGRSSTYARLAVVTDRMIWEADAKLKRERSADGCGEYPPQFTMRLRDRRVQATYPVRLTCQVVGSPPPKVTWYKDGQPVETDKRHCQSQDEHFHTLEIAPTTLEDGGVYEALARNSSGAVSCRCSLVVDKGIRAYVAPEFCCGLEPLYRLSNGEELRISAVVEAYPSVGVTWYRDGVRLRPNRRAVMTLDRDGQIELALAAVTQRDAGVYTCTASNEVGRASTSGKVEVIGGETEEKKPPPVLLSPDVPYSKEPMFVRKPRSSSAREGDTVIIQCEVVGDPKPDVYWLRDFLKPDYYRDASHFRRVGLGPEYRFEIPHAKLDYTGAYSVVARNVHGETKAVISLQILAKDPTSSDDAHNIRYGEVEVLPRFEKELTDLLSCDGDAVEFECRISGHPAPDIRWFHYHELIRESEDFEWTIEDGSARLKIRQVTADDEGNYTCEAANCLGKASSSACLVVYPAGEPNTLCQRLRRPAALGSCTSTPRSTPRATPARSLSRARTPGPETFRQSSPARQMAPTFYTYPFNKVAEEGDTVTLQCAVKGLPAPWATWDKDGVIITPSSRITLKEKDEILRILEIEQVTIEDVGVYRITVENEFGRAEASARLEVITQRGKFYAGVRAYSPSPRRSLTYRSRRPSTPRQD